MKKLILTVAAISMAATSLFAEGLNVTAGYNTGIAKQTWGGTRSTDIYNGFNLGVGYTFRDAIADRVNIATGLQYVSMFGKKNSYDEDLKMKGQQMDSYIQLPVRFSYLFDMENCSFFLFAGPKFLFGLRSQFVTDSLKFNWYARSTEQQYSRFNLMLGAGAGMYIGEHLRISLGYDWGLLNRYKGDLKNLGNKLYQSMVTVNVAYCF